MSDIVLCDMNTIAVPSNGDLPTAAVYPELEHLFCQYA